MCNSSFLCKIASFIEVCGSPSMTSIFLLHYFSVCKWHIELKSVRSALFLRLIPVYMRRSTLGSRGGLGNGCPFPSRVNIVSQVDSGGEATVSLIQLQLIEHQGTRPAVLTTNRLCLLTPALFNWVHSGWVVQITACLPSCCHSHP